MANGDFKREISDKVLHDRAFDNLKNPNFGGYQCELTSVVYKFWIKTWYSQRNK